VLSTLVVVEGPGLGVGDAGPAGGLALAAVAAVVGWLFLAAVRHGAVGSAYGADGTPGAVLVGADGTLRGHLHNAPGATDATSLSRRRALALFALTVVGAALSLRPAKATACGALCRSSSDCPGTCINCKKRPGEMFGHCH
jgi:hypothetical protein